MHLKYIIAQKVVTEDIFICTCVKMPHTTTFKKKRRCSYGHKSIETSQKKYVSAQIVAIYNQLTYNGRKFCRRIMPS